MIIENDVLENIFFDIVYVIRLSIIVYLGIDKFIMKSEIVLGYDKLIDYIKDGEYF